MEYYQRRPERKGHGRERPTDPDGCNVVVTYNANVGECSWDIPPDVNIVYLKEVVDIFADALLLRKQSNQSADSGGKDFDVFVSHASEDKSGFVDSLVFHLNHRGLRVWYDSSRINFGDSVRRSIDQGLKKARYGLIILSPTYLRKYWCSSELDALFELESASNKVVLLPIWHGVNRRDILQYSPILASRKALSSAELSVDEIANEIVRFVAA